MWVGNVHLPSFIIPYGRLPLKWPFLFLSTPPPLICVWHKNWGYVAQPFLTSLTSWLSCLQKACFLVCSPCSIVTRTHPILVRKTGGLPALPVTRQVSLIWCQSVNKSTVVTDLTSHSPIPPYQLSR